VLGWECPRASRGFAVAQVVAVVNCNHSGLAWWCQLRVQYWELEGLRTRCECAVSTCLWMGGDGRVANSQRSYVLRGLRFESLRFSSWVEYSCSADMRIAAAGSTVHGAGLRSDQWQFVAPDVVKFCVLRHRSMFPGCSVTSLASPALYNAIVHRHPSIQRARSWTYLNSLLLLHVVVTHSVSYL
jgi:hypothetical protein